MSSQGPRGRDGTPGRSGHDGTDGDTGDTGARGGRGKDGGWVLFVMTMAAVTALAWAGEHRSCARQDAPRAALRLFADTAYNARTAAAELDRERGDEAAWKVDHDAAAQYARSRDKARPLDCDGFFPDTQ